MCISLRAVKVAAVPDRSVASHLTCLDVKLVVLLHVACKPLVIAQLAQMAVSAQRLYIVTPGCPSHHERQLVVLFCVGRMEAFGTTQ